MPFAWRKRNAGPDSNGSNSNGSNSVPEIHVRVRGGYIPDTVHAEIGAPTRIVFHREESSACSEQVVFPAFGKSAMLPEGTDVAVDLPPAEPGTYEFTCAMGMLRGRLVVAPAERYAGPSAPAGSPTQLGGDRR